MSLSAFHAPARAQATRVELIIRDVAVLDPGGNAWLPHRDIVVKGTTISSIAATGSALPDAKFSINGAGKFVIPGLFDNRVRISAITPPAAGLFIAHGVTSIADRDSEDARRASWQRDVAYGKLMGPRLIDASADNRLPASRAGIANVAPGESLFVVLEQLAKTGMTPAAILKLATIDSARAGGRGHDLGSIDTGKIADAIVLDGDPLRSIEHLRRIDAVIFRGEVLTRAHLNQLLTRAQRTAR